MFRAMLWAGVGIFGGQLVQTLPQYTSFWGLGACVLLILASHYVDDVPSRFRAAAWVGAAILVSFCFYKAMMEYTGANYPLNYRICGVPDKRFGPVEGVIVGIELSNPNKIDLFGRTLPEKYSLSSWRYNDPSKPPAKPFVVHHSTEDPDDDIKDNHWLPIDPPLPEKTFGGHFHQEFEYGANKGLKRTLTIDGDWNVILDDRGTPPLFTFSPTPGLSAGWIGPCDIQRHVSGPLPI